MTKSYDGVGSASSVLDLKFARSWGRPPSELQIQKAHEKHKLASVVIDSEARRSPPRAYANFGIGTLELEVGFELHARRGAVVVDPAAIGRLFGAERDADPGVKAWRDPVGHA